ncbi:hypothetical protein [Komagataeibacter xylinus]|uniref:Uncharacterized protein n=1 Tax=Komagataeibacter xylinus TaxID=28448 RepID=A0A857FLP4_KOMXY|nr:hypothetical protein [Komagataeibacter xylinus]QHC35188.1 hypothetical protein FMA36_06430 [Komagataeibacter xylinus]
MDTMLTTQTILSLLPARYAADAVVIFSFLISGCALVARFWRPPAAGSKWVVVWTLVTAMAQLRGWNRPADRKGDVTDRKP